MSRHWASFPLEMQDNILNMLTQDIGANKISSILTKTGISRYSRVCKTWQTFFEPYLYRHLTLSQFCLEKFERYVHRQRSLVECIELRISVTSHECPDCDLNDSLPGMTKTITESNNEIVGTAIRELLRLLHPWGRGSQESGITLEISLHSPNDLRYCPVGHFYFDSELPGNEYMESRWANIVDKKWNSDFRAEPLSARRIETIFEQPEPDWPKENDPTDDFSVQVVRKLSLCRRTRRSLKATSVVDLVAYLPNLDHFHYEVWRDFLRDKNTGFSITNDIGLIDLCSNHESHDLKTFTLFFDFNEVYDRIMYDHYQGSRGGLHKCPHKLFHSTLARASRNLVKLAVSYLAEAKDFFEHCEGFSSVVHDVRRPDRQWSRLTYLGLTSRLLVQTTQHSKIMEMLISAGWVALRMPKLEKLELWNASRRSAGVFRYSVKETGSTIVWSGTWHLELEPELLGTWNEVARLHTAGRQELLVEQGNIFPEDEIISHGHAIRKLGLDKQVIHPESLEDIQRESERYFSSYYNKYSA